MKSFILTIDCPDSIGIVRAVSNFFYELGCSVVEAAEYADIDSKKFFARWQFQSTELTKQDLDVDFLRKKFAVIAAKFSMNAQFFDAQKKPRVLLAVSQHGHCLNDLLNRWSEEKSFPAEIVGVISNHEVFRDKVEWHGLPFYHLPITKETKPQQEQQILDVMSELNVDLLVLARYMQILSDNLCQQLQGRAINIHHSFLPSFKGAKPYHQAKARGVKISGATAHYVTSDLDEGPIIEQDVQRVDHTMGSDKMVRLGRNIENIVLARAVYWHCQHRIILDGNRTIIFK